MLIETRFALSFRTSTISLAVLNSGLLARKNVEGDRRKVQLLCTDKAQPIISRGQQLQEHFVEQLFADIDDATRQTIFQGMQQMELNLNLILEDN